MAACRDICYDNLVDSFTSSCAAIARMLDALAEFPSFSQYIAHADEVNTSLNYAINFIQLDDYIRARSALSEGLAHAKIIERLVLGSSPFARTLCSLVGKLYKTLSQNALDEIIKLAPQFTDRTTEILEREVPASRPILRVVTREETPRPPIPVAVVAPSNCERTMDGKIQPDYVLKNRRDDCNCPLCHLNILHCAFASKRTKCCTNQTCAGNYTRDQMIHMLIDLRPDLSRTRAKSVFYALKNMRSGPRPLYQLGIDESSDDE